MKKSLLLTFDYELFLGKSSGSVHECMITPTELLRKVLSKHGVTAIFFVDTTYLLTGEKNAQLHEAARKDFEDVSNQVRALIGDGHYVFPHIHPHWVDAEYHVESNEYTLNDISKYRFHNLTIAQRETIFNGSIRILKEIIHPIKPGYEINAYRAGGWSIQPFEDFLPAFNTNNIKYDFSVMAGMYQYTKAQYFDFSNKVDKDIYRFGTDVLKEEKDGPFIEVSSNILQIPKQADLLHRIHQKYLWFIKKDYSYGKGIGQYEGNIKDIQPTSPEGKQHMHDRYEFFSLELLSIAKVGTYLNFFKENNYMHFVSHPKMLSEHNIDMLDRFVGKAKAKYEIETDFKKIIASTL